MFAIVLDEDYQGAVWPVRDLEATLEAAKAIDVVAFPVLFASAPNPRPAAKAKRDYAYAPDGSSHAGGVYEIW